MAVDRAGRSGPPRGARPASGAHRAAAPGPAHWLAVQWQRAQQATSELVRRAQSAVRPAAKRVPAAPLKPAAHRSVNVVVRPPQRSAARPPAATPGAGAPRAPSASRSSSRPSAAAQRTVAPQQPRAASVPARQPNAVQSVLNSTAQFFGATSDSLVHTAQQVTQQAQQFGTQATQRVRQFGSEVAAQARAIEQSAPAQAARQRLEAAAGVAWRGAKTVMPVLAPLNPLAPLAGALSQTPAGRALAKTPVAQALEGLDRKFSGEVGPVPMATRSEFQSKVKPQDRAEVAAVAQQIAAQQRLVLGDKAVEAGHDSSKSLLQGGIDEIRWMFTGRRDDMDHVLNTTEHKLDVLQRDVMTGKVGASQARHQLAATTRDYYGQYVGVQNARAGQLGVGIAALQGVRGASEMVVTMTATTLAGPAGGVAVGTGVRELNKAAHEWSAQAHGTTAPRESLIRYGIDVARGEQVKPETRHQVLQSFGGSVLGSATDAATAMFSVGRTASLLQAGTFTGRAGAMRAAAVAQTEAHLLFRSTQAVGQAAVEAVQNPDMTLQHKAEHVGTAALGEALSLPFTYLGAGVGMGLAGGRTLASAGRQMAGDAVTGLAEQGVRTAVVEGRAMTAEEMAGAVTAAAVGGLNNFSQHPSTARPAAEAAYNNRRPTSSNAGSTDSQPRRSADALLEGAGVPRTLHPRDPAHRVAARMTMMMDPADAGDASRADGGESDPRPAPQEGADPRWPADVSGLEPKAFAQLYEKTYQGGLAKLADGTEQNFPASASKAAELYDLWAPADAKQLRELQQQHPHVPYPVVVAMRVLTSGSRLPDLPMGTVATEALGSIVANPRTGLNRQTATERRVQGLLPPEEFAYFTDNINPKTQASENRQTRYFPPGGAPESVYRDFARALVSGNATYANQLADPRNPTVAELNDLAKNLGLDSRGIFVMTDPLDPSRVATMSATAYRYGQIDSLDGARYPAGSYLYLGQLTGGRLAGSGKENINSLQALVANSAAYEGIALYTYNPLNAIYLKQGFRLTAVRYDPEDGRIRFHYRWHESVTPLAVDGDKPPHWPRNYALNPEEVPPTVGQRLPPRADDKDPRTELPPDPAPTRPSPLPLQLGEDPQRGPLFATIGPPPPPLPQPPRDTVGQLVLGVAGLLDRNPVDALTTWAEAGITRASGALAKRTSGAIARRAKPLANWMVGLPASVWSRLPEETRADMRAVWTRQPETWMPDSAHARLDPATSDALQQVTVVPDAAWQQLSPDLQAQLLKAAQGNIYTVEQGRRLDEKTRQAVLQAPLGIGTAIEWTFVGRNGSESLVTKVAQGVDKLWQWPPVEIVQGTAKAIGILAHKGFSALMVIEAAAGGPKVHLYNPVSRQPITEPALEALSIGYVPQTDRTISVTLQGSLVPSASITFWASGPVMRGGIPRLDRKKDGDVLLNRVISTWMANLGTVGVVAKIGVPNAHWARGLTLRPVGEIGANPLVGMTSLQSGTAKAESGQGPKGSLDAYSLGVLDPMGFLGVYDTVRIGSVAVTPLRVVNDLGPGVRVFGGTSGFRIERTPGVGHSPASAFQTNPAFNWSMRKEPPRSSELTADGKHLLATWPNANGGSSVGMFVRTRGAFEVERSLFVDPATGWMALRSNNSTLPPLWIDDRTANAIKAGAEDRGGRFDAAAFQADPIKAPADQWLQALQTEPGRARVAAEILRLGGGHRAEGLKTLSAQVSDPTLRAVLAANVEFFRALADANGGSTPR